MANKTKFWNNVSEMLSTTGPIVSVVVLATDGTCREETVDMSPTKRGIEHLLGMNGNSFVGQYWKNNVIVVRSARPPEGTPLNQHCPLPPPLDAEGAVLGDIVLVRMNDSANPEPFTLADWQLICLSGDGATSAVATVNTPFTTEPNVIVAMELGVEDCGVHHIDHESSPISTNSTGNTSTSTCYNETPAEKSRRILSDLLATFINTNERSPSEEELLVMVETAQ